MTRHDQILAVVRDTIEWVKERMSSRPAGDMLLTTFCFYGARRLQCV